MLTPLERVNNLLADLRYAQVDFDALFPGRNSLTLHIPDQTRHLHGEFPPVRRRKSAMPPEVSASNMLCQPQGLAEPSR